MAATSDERRPTPVLLVTTWDIVQATFAALGAMVPFGTGETIHGVEVELPLWEQLLTSLSYIALCAVFIVLAVLMARRQRSVRRAQVAVLLMQVGLQVLVALVAFVTRDPSSDWQTVALRSALVAILDLAAVTTFTAPVVSSWFREPGRLPRGVALPAAVWASSSVAVLAVELLRGLG